MKESQIIRQWPINLTIKVRQFVLYFLICYEKIVWRFCYAERFCRSRFYDRETLCRG
jgi:hypothetical protein